MIERVIVGPFHTNTYIVTIAKKECILIDPGAEAQNIISRLDVLNVTPRLIVLTHGHLDHLSASAEIIARYQQDEATIPVLLHPDDRYLLDTGESSPAREIFEPFGDDGVNAFRSMIEGVPTIETSLQDGAPVGETDFRVLHTPGHTPGSVCFYSETREIVFSGDTLFFKAAGRTDFDRSNSAALEKSIRSVLFELPPQTRLFPGHGPYSTIERELANNRFSTDHTMI